MSNYERWAALEAAEPTLPAHIAPTGSTSVTYAPTVRAPSGTISVSTVDNMPVTETRNTHRFSTAEFTDNTILGSARNGGFPARGNVTDKSVVQTPHGSMQVSTAVAIGLLNRGADGSYTEASEEQFRAKHTPANTATVELAAGHAPLDSNTQLAHEFLHQALPTYVTDSLANSIMEMALGSRESAYDSRQLSGHVDGAITAEQMDRVVQTTIAGYQAQVDKIISAQGIQPQEFYTWAQKHAKPEMKIAMTHTYYRQDTSGWTGLINKYIAKSGVTPPTDQLVKAGYQVFTPRGKEPMVVIDGIQMSVAQATKLRLFR